MPKAPVRSTPRISMNSHCPGDIDKPPSVGSSTPSPIAVSGIARRQAQPVAGAVGGTAQIRITSSGPGVIGAPNRDQRASGGAAVAVSFGRAARRMDVELRGGAGSGAGARDADAEAPREGGSAWPWSASATSSPTDAALFDLAGSLRREVLAWFAERVARGEVELIEEKTA
jgi:hypothetical protein